MSRRWFWAAVALGWSLIAFAAAGIAGDARDVPPTAFLRSTLGILALHDLLFAPLVLLVARSARRLRAPVRTAVARFAIVGGSLALFSVPFVAGWGRLATNPSVLPRDYTRGLFLALAGAALIAAASALVGRHSKHAGHV